MNGKNLWKEVAVPLGLLILFVIAFSGVFSLSKKLAKTPTIELISGDQIVTDQSEVPITGVVKNTSKLVIQNKEVPVENDGSFSVVVPVNVGENVVELAAGKSGQTKTNVTIVREEVSKATTITSAPTNNLASSGPVETFVGSFGLAAIVLSLTVFHRSTRQKTLQKA